MLPGRPSKSRVRERIAEILSNIGFSYGYDIYKIYKKVYGNVLLRTIYYNLKKGVEDNEFLVVEVKRTPGQFTWGNETERVYYTLGPFANFPQSKNTDKFMEFKRNENNVDWKKEITALEEDLIKDINDFLDHKKKYRYGDRHKLAARFIEKISKLDEYSKSKISDYKISPEFNELKTKLKDI